MRARNVTFVAFNRPPREGRIICSVAPDLFPLMETASNSGRGVAGWPKQQQPNRRIPTAAARSIAIVPGYRANLARRSPKNRDVWQLDLLAFRPASVCSCGTHVAFSQLIFRWPFHMIDDQDIGWAFRGFEFQAELILQSRENRRAIRLSSRWRFGTRRQSQ